ncbi:hypothetical protein ACA910_002568 [Epithemia clementina (nom. ined.)]
MDQSPGSHRPLVEWAQSSGPIDRKALERICGFLVYVSLTYGMMVPYLKGLHLTLQSWHPDRDVDGWRMTPQEWSVFLKNNEGDVHYDGGNDDPPHFVTAVPRFKEDVHALATLTTSRPPPPILVQPNGLGTAAMMFGDESGTGFGTSLWLQGTREINAEHGIWMRAYGKHSSNFQELFNLVERVSVLVKDKTIQDGTELFVFTDNSTAESAFYRGTSKSKLLYNLVL